MHSKTDDERKNLVKSTRQFRFERPLSFIEIRCREIFRTPGLLTSLAAFAFAAFLSSPAFGGAGRAAGARTGFLSRSLCGLLSGRRFLLSSRLATFFLFGLNFVDAFGLFWADGFLATNWFAGGYFL